MEKIRKIQVGDVTYEIEDQSKPGMKTDAGGEVFNDTENNSATGGNSHAEGSGTEASGDAAHAEGYGTKAAGYYSHSEGSGTKALGLDSHAEGENTIARNDYSHAEGYGTEAAADYSHAEGFGTRTSGDNSHAEGIDTVAGGFASHTEGSFTVTQNENEHAQGIYNRSNTGASPADMTLHSIGVGVSGTDRRNAVEVMSNGDVYVKGVGGYDGTNPSDADHLAEVISGKVDKTDGKGLSTNDYTNEEKQKVADAQPKLVSGTNIKTVNGQSLLGEGDIQINATTDLSSCLVKTEQTLTDEEKTQVQENIGVSEYMVGKKTGVQGAEIFNSYGENTASGLFSHAEGAGTKVTSAYGHAEGLGTEVSGTAAVAGHAEGYGTLSQNPEEHAEGRFNASHTGSTDADKTLHSVGIGESTDDRKNAVEIMQNGDVYVKGVGGYDGTNPGTETVGSKSIPRTLQYHIKKRSPLPKIVVGRAIPIDARPGYIYRANCFKIRRREGLRMPYNLANLAMGSDSISAEDIIALSHAGSSTQRLDITVPMLLMPAFWESHANLDVILVKLPTTKFYKIGSRKENVPLSAANMTDVSSTYNSMTTPTASPNLMLDRNVVVPTVAAAMLNPGANRTLDVSSFADCKPDKNHESRKMFYTRRRYLGGRRTRNWNAATNSWVSSSIDKKEIMHRRRYCNAAGYFTKHYCYKLGNKDSTKKGHGRMCCIELQRKLRKRYWATVFYANVNIRKTLVEV